MTGQHDPRSAKARVLALGIALLEAEVELMQRLRDQGIIPLDARREPTAPELRAGVRFAELDRIVNNAAGLIARKADRVRDHVLDGLADQLAGIMAQADPWAAVEELARLTDPTNPAAIAGLADVITAVEDEVTEDLLTTARAGAAEALDEARRQGLPDRLIPDVDPVNDTLEAAARAQAANVAKAPAIRLLDVAAEAGARAATTAGATGADVIAAALDGAENASRAGQEDTARQAANVTHGLGRAAAQAQLPAPREVYASELLDRNTCGPCATVDGRTYETLEAGLVDYPGAGGFVGCDGGSRCRGTLVLVHNTEAAPTLDGPGDGRPGPGGGPADRTPRGPASPAPAPATGPQLPDVGAPEVTALATAPLDDATGRTTMPVEDLEPPVTTVAPDTIPRDEDLARLNDDELDAILLDDAVPYDRKLAAADELDQRAAGTRSQVWDEEELDAATLARYEEEREAWERAGGYAADTSYGTGASTKPAGRLIDRVRSEWADQLHMDYLSAEDVTRGTLIRRDRYAEFTAKYGSSTAALFEGPARIAYYYASRELRDHWDTLPGGRPSFAEFAVARGVQDAKMTKRARVAAEAREEARARADESAAGQAKRARQRAEDRRRRLPLTEGERLARAQRRRDRIRAAERKNAAEFERLRDEFGPSEDT